MTIKRRLTRSPPTAKQQPAKQTGEFSIGTSGEFSPGSYNTGRRAFFGTLAPLADRRAFQRHLSPVRNKRWVVYAKPPFAGPEAVLVYLSRYTHRVAISNPRLLAFDATGVTFRYKDYRRHARTGSAS